MTRLLEYRSGKVALDEVDLAHLLALVKGESDAEDAKVIQSITPTRNAGIYRVKPGGFVGRLGLPSGEVLDVESRFEIDDLVELLRYSGRLPIRLDRLKPAMDHNRFLTDIIATAFGREVERIVSFGLAKGYRQRRFDRPPYPGRPDVARHLSRYAARPDKLITNAQRITIDVEVNQALAAALKVLTRIPLAPEPKRALRAISPAFVRISDVAVAAESLSRLNTSRLTSRYEDALGLSELVLRSQSLVPEGAGHAGASVLFNMPKVWEACVARWAEESWGPDYQVTDQHGFDISSDGMLSAIADVTVWREGKLHGLYDAKYKWPGEKPTMGDVYQMVTYCTRLNISEATLVYPVKFAGRSFRIRDVTVHTLGLDPQTLIDDPTRANSTLSTV